MRHERGSAYAALNQSSCTCCIVLSSALAGGPAADPSAPEGILDDSPWDAAPADSGSIDESAAVIATVAELLPVSVGTWTSYSSSAQFPVAFAKEDIVSQDVQLPQQQHDA